MKLQRHRLVIYSIITLSLLRILYNINAILNLYSDKSLIRSINLYDEFPNMKYVLKFSASPRSPFMYIPEGQETFVKRNCSVQNCYITSDRTILDKITEFHVILFNGPYVVQRLPDHCLPKERLPNQSYIFVSTESSDYYYVPDNRYNEVFNYSWTYKLSSDIYYGYMIIRNKKGEIIGPRENMSWIHAKDMLPIDETVKKKLKHKKLAVAWFVSNCHAHSKRDKWALKIDNELSKYNMSVDIYGDCMYKRCPHASAKKCSQMIQRDYYFYFAFENSIGDDYVTEKLLRPLQNYAVPVVLGGADYKRFMPDGIYLNAREMSVKYLVKQMVDAIKDKSKYYTYFKWHNHYSYHSPDEDADTDSFCEFCDFVNKIKPKSHALIENFFEWWNPHVVVNAQVKDWN